MRSRLIDGSHVTLHYVTTALELSTERHGTSDRRARSALRAGASTGAGAGAGGEGGAPTALRGTPERR